jgi:ketosteroid isomerase-like protein
MSQENVEIVRRVYEAHRSGDFGTALALIDPDVRCDVSFRPDTRVFHGHQGVVDALNTWIGTWDGFSSVIEELIDAGDHVICVEQQSGRGKGSGIPLEQRVFAVFTIYAGKVVHMAWFFKRSEAREAAGLSEQGDTAPAMSEENLETVRRAYEGVTARFATPRELVHPEYEVDASEISPEGEWPRGYDASEEILREYWLTFDKFHVELEEVIHADDGLVVDVVRDGGQLKGSDAEVWNRYFHVWTFRDGKIAGLSIHTDRNRALEAARLSE